jgi:hypothetical protein
MTEARLAGEEAGGTALLRRPDGGPAEVVVDGKLQIERIAGLPVQVDVRVPLPNFRVADLLSLAAGSVVASEWPSSEDIPLSCGDVHLVWTEFEVVDHTLAIRVTRLA